MSPSSPRSPWSNKQSTNDIVPQIGASYIFLYVLTESPLGPGGPSGPGGPCGENLFSCKVKILEYEYLNNAVVPEGREHQAIQSPHQDQDPPEERRLHQKFCLLYVHNLPLLEKCLVTCCPAGPFVPESP